MHWRKTLFWSLPSCFALYLLFSPQFRPLKALLQSSPWLIMHREAKVSAFEEPYGPYPDPGPRIDLGLSSLGVGKTKNHITYWASDLKLDKEEELTFNLHALSGKLGISINGEIVMEETATTLKDFIRKTISLPEGTHHLCVSLIKTHTLSKLDLKISPKDSLAKPATHAHPITNCPPTLDE